VPGFVNPVVMSNLEMFVGVAKKPQHLGAKDSGEHRQAAGAVARKANDPLNPTNRVGSNCGGAYETFARGPHIQHQSRAQRRPQKQ
jgi:hypothetical protein